MLLVWYCIAIISGVYLFRYLSSPISKIPGPWYTKFTGLVIKYHEFSATRREFVHNLHEKHGPVVRLSPNEVSFATLEAIREIYASGGSGYEKTEYYDLFKQYGIKTMFSTLDKHGHSQRKRELADRYAMSNVLSPTHISAIRDRARAFVSKCTPRSTSVDVFVCSSAMTQTYLIIQVLLHCYALDCVTSFMFSPLGLRSLDQKEDFEIMQELTYHQSLQKNLLHYYLPYLVPYFPDWLIPRHAPITNAYVLRMARQEAPDQQSLVARLARRDSPLSHVQIAAECKDHMAAGIDTTGDALCFLMYELSQPENMHIQEKLHDELRNATTNTTLDHLPYLDAIIKESLRLWPPIPMSLPRHVPRDGRSISGYFLPQNTIVGVQSYSVHRLNEEVFPDANRFNPDRWLEAKGFAERNRYFFSFGTGGRGCTGKNLALVEMKLLLQEVYSRFRSTIAPDMDGSMVLDDQIISARPKDQKCMLVFSHLHSDDGITQ